MNIEHRPISIDVVLYANSAPAKDLNGNVMRITLTEANKVDDYNWTYTFKNLPKYDSKGNKIIYTISEENLRYGETEDETGFYNPTVDQTKLTITNTPVKNNDKVGLTITKEWVGNEFESSHRPKYITFIIRRITYLLLLILSITPDIAAGIPVNAITHDIMLDTPIRKIIIPVISALSIRSFGSSLTLIDL